MLESILTWPLVAGCALGGAGLYLLLVARQRLALVAGAASACVALGLLALQIHGKAEWWPEQASASPATSPVFVLCGLLCIAAAGMTVTARTVLQSSAWFAAALVCIAGLYVAHAAVMLAVVALLAACGAAALLLKKMKPGGAAAAWDLSKLRPWGPAHSALTASQSEPVSNGGPTGANEPALVCVAASLLALLLMGTLHHALAAGSVGDVDRLRAAVMRRAASLEFPEARRRLDAPQPAVEWFGGRPVAAGMSVVLLLAALLAARAMTRTAEPGPGEAVLPPPAETCP
jgi:hypothetical protein